jgi:predicted DNA-binding transcriptional regulator YafY
VKATASRRRRKQRSLLHPKIAGRAGLERLLMTAELLRQFRFGVEVAYIHHEINLRHGRVWHVRTVKRDLDLLERLGVATAIGSGRWRWIGTKSILEMSPQELIG